MLAASAAAQPPGRRRFKTEIKKGGSSAGVAAAGGPCPPSVVGVTGPGRRDPFPPSAAPGDPRSPHFGAEIEEPALCSLFVSRLSGLCEGVTYKNGIKQPHPCVRQPRAKNCHCPERLVAKLASLYPSVSFARPEHARAAVRIAARAQESRGTMAHFPKS
eukprot:gene21203-biopygen11650